jgi:asparagine synthase (glutamine-hydrolysing)
MCGINGLYGLNERLAEEKIAAMNTSMAHRGPDDQGVFTTKKIALGHRRLSIIDLSSDGHQPMHSYDNRYSIIYNGELYNYKKLKFELQRVVSGSGQQTYLFNTNTDTEVILAAYIRWGTDCLSRFNGMFAFAIWDNQKEELFIARDRLGIKPLYYFYSNGIFGFSSEIRSLLASGLIPKELDKKSLVDYLRYQTVHAPDTIVKGIKMLMPGHFIELKDKKVTLKNYWTLSESISDLPKGKNYDAVCADINKLLTEGVERRLIADVPFGAFLSGGIDSSAIVGLMSKVSSEKVKTFSVTFDESEFSESRYAQLIAKKFNTDHHEIRLTPDDFINELPYALKSMDHPSGDGPNTYVVSKATKSAGITMALSGLGGDELFAGYDVFKRALELNQKNWLNLFPQFLRATAAGILTNVKPGVASEKIAGLLKQDKINFSSFYPLSRQVLMDDQIFRLLKTQELPLNKVSEILSEIHLDKIENPLSRVSVAEISTYMQNVLLRDTDQMSMAHALEVRVPFLDYTLVEYVLGVPDKFKSTVSPKKLLVDALGDLLPDEIVHRSKMGFTFPWKQWMKKELKDFCEQKLLSLAKRESFNEKGIVNLWSDFLNDKPGITWSRIWHLIVLENWMQENKFDN